LRENYEREYLEAEKTNPWFICRRALIYSLLERFDRNVKILDYGCGSGCTLEYLHDRGFKKLKGVDVSSTMRSAAVGKISKNISPGDRADVILMLDVLEHIEDEKGVLNSIRAILNKNGYLIITVPAFNFLWSGHDELNRHYRRYNKKTLRTAIDAAHLKMERMFYWDCLLFLPIAVVRILKRGTTERSDFKTMPRALAPLFESCLKWENRFISRGVNFPFGISLLAVVRND
jgi:2-polyprenyl-3-methyl-5-hydroxy-6-metoxy-1,4-benzoquinol methylase